MVRHVPDQQTTLDTIAGLAEEIARTNPDCADKALNIIRLLGDIGGKPDKASIEDAIEAEAAGDLSDTTVRNATNAVIKTMRNEV
jgi:hypothetical protein